MMVSQKEIIEELRGECNGCKRDMLADRIEAEGIAPESSVDALIAEAVATEREACAQIAMDFWCDAGAVAIRARGAEVKFTYGETDEARKIRLREWHPFFTILPRVVAIKKGKYECRWLETIERRAEWRPHWDGGDFSWEYRARGAGVSYKKSPVTINCNGKLVVDPSVLTSGGIKKEIDAARKLKKIIEAIRARGQK